MKHLSLDCHGRLLLDNNSDGFLLTEKAYEKIKREGLEYIYELEGFSQIDIMTIGLEEEKGSYSRPSTIFENRIKNYVNNDGILNNCWTLKEDAYNWLEEEYGHALSKDSRDLDAITALFVQKTQPIWNIYNIQADAAALIRYASMTDEDLKIFAAEARKGIYLKAANGVLFDSYNEMLVYGDYLYLGSSYKALSTFVRYEKASDELLGFAARFIALKNCGGYAPIEEKETNRNMRLERLGIKITKGIMKRDIYLSEHYRSLKRRPGRKGIDDFEKRISDKEGKVLNKEGKVLTIVNVSGYFRRAPFFYESDLKRIWVSSFQRGQWVNSGLTYVTVRDKAIPKETDMTKDTSK